MSSSFTAPELNAIPADKRTQRQLAIRRAEYLKKLKIRVKESHKKIDEDRLIIIETFNTDKNISVELVMRRLSELDCFVAHVNNQFGGHIIPVFKYDLYFQESINMGKLVGDIEEYLNDLKHNKYCRQDLKFYCFIIEQHAQFPRELGIGKIISNATDKSRRYLNDIFTRKNLPSLRDTNIMVYSHRQLQTKIQQYTQIKQLSLIKSSQTLVFEQVSQILAELSAWPGIAIQPQQLDIQFICKTIKSSQKLIEQSTQAYMRWQKLADSVMELQNNVYKGLHEYQWQFNQKNDQLKEWSQSLSRQFNDLSEYLTDKIQALCVQVYKINKRFIDMTVFAGQSVVIEEEDIGNGNGGINRSEGSRPGKHIIQVQIKLAKQRRKPQIVQELEIKKQQNSATQNMKQQQIEELQPQQINQQIQLSPQPDNKYQLDSQKQISETEQKTESSNLQNSPTLIPILKPKQQILCDDN